MKKASNKNGISFKPSNKVSKIMSTINPPTASSLQLDYNLIASFLQQLFILLPHFARTLIHLLQQKHPNHVFLLF